MPHQLDKVTIKYYKLENLNLNMSIVLRIKNYNFIITQILYFYNLKWTHTSLNLVHMDTHHTLANTHSLRHKDPESLLHSHSIFTDSFNFRLSEYII